MGKIHVTPWTVAVALIQASQDADAASRAVETCGPASISHTSEDAQELLSVSLATAVVRLDQLRKVDPRADFGAVHQMLLEYLPPLVAGDPSVTAQQLDAVGSQLGTLAHEVLALDGLRPSKPLDVAGALAEEKR